RRRMDAADAKGEAASEWYAEGLRFTCTQCGNCCTGPPGYVWFDLEEGRRVAARLGLSEADFYRSYARKVNGHWSFKERKSDHGFDCIFLDRTSRPGAALCSIYEDRPVQCRTWPFWPENLSSRRAWEGAKRRTPCPGMDSGKLVPIEKIRIE